MRLNEGPLRPQAHAARLAAAFNGSVLVRSLAASAQQSRKRVVAGAATTKAQQQRAPEESGKGFGNLGLSEELTAAVSAPWRLSRGMRRTF